MLRFKLAEVMARHGVQAKDLAKTLSVNPVTVSAWKTGKKQPALARLDAIAQAITILSQRGEVVKGTDLLENTERKND
jgi:transcriptional regulator with XRE-family HTH domain